MVSNIYKKKINLLIQTEYKEFVKICIYFLQSNK